MVRSKESNKTDFVLSESLARQILDLMSPDDRLEAEKNLYLVRTELSEIWHGQILAYSNFLRTANQSESVLINQHHQLNYKVLKIIDGCGGIPAKDWEQRSDLVKSFSQEYAAYVRSNCPLSYSWGTLESRDDTIVMTIKQKCPITLDELISKSGFSY